MAALSVSFEAQRVVEAWGDGGPWCELADVPERRCVITLVRRLEGLRADAPAGSSVGLWEGPRPGDEGELRFGVTTGRADRTGVTVRSRCVVRAVRHRLRRGVAEQEVELLALASAGGGGDPLVIGEAGPGGLV